jgi:DNA-binding beta-propeller fold protein YncE
VDTTTSTRPVTGRSRQQALIRQARERQHRRRRRIAVLALTATIGGAIIVGVIRGGHRPSTAAPPPPAGAGRSRTVERPGRTYLTGQRYRGPAVFAAIEPAHGRLGPIREGAGTAISPNGQLMLDLDGSADRVLVTDLATGRPERPVDVGAGPSAIAFSPDSRTAYIADSGSALSAAGMASAGSSPSTQPSDLVTPIDLRTDRAGPAIRVCAGPRGLAVSAAAHLLIVTCQSTVALVDTRTDRLVRSLGIGGYDRDIVAISPDGDTAVVGDTQLGDGPIPSGTIVPIDLITETAGPPIPIGDRAGTGGALNLTFPPGASNRLYVTTGRLGHSGPVYPEVFDVDLVTQTVSAPLRLAGQPIADLSVWSDGQTGYLAWEDTGHGSVTYRVSLSLHRTGHIIHLNNSDPNTIVAAQAPYLIAIGRNQRQITVINAATGNTQTIKTPYFTNQILR